MTVYAIFIKRKTYDPDGLKKYGEMAGEAAKGFALDPIAFFGNHENMEGQPAEGAVIMRFGDMEAAKAWYFSPGYQKAKAQRNASADFDVIFVEGVK